MRKIGWMTPFANFSSDAASVYEEADVAGGAAPAPASARELLSEGYTALAITRAQSYHIAIRTGTRALYTCSLTAYSKN